MDQDTNSSLEATEVPQEKKKVGRPLFYGLIVLAIVVLIVIVALSFGGSDKRRQLRSKLLKSKPDYTMAIEPVEWILKQDDVKDAGKTKEDTAAVKGDTAKGTSVEPSADSQGGGARVVETGLKYNWKTIARTVSLVIFALLLLSAVVVGVYLYKNNSTLDVSQV